MVIESADTGIPHGPNSRDAGGKEKEFTIPAVDAIVKKYDAESNFRNLKSVTAKITVVLCVMLSLFHIYTAGFGLLNEVMHRTVHLSFMFVYAPSMLFIDFSWTEFSIAMTSGVLGIISLSAAYIGYFKNRVGLMGKIALTIGGLLLVSSSYGVILVGAGLVLLILIPNFMGTSRTIPVSD